MATVFHLAGRTYTTKSAIKDIVRKIVAEAKLDTPLRGQRFAFMCDLFTRHPRAEGKIGPGVDEIVVRVAARNRKNREFWIRQVGSDEFIDISWTECITWTSPLSEFRNACRLAVKADTQAFADDYFENHAVSGHLRCPLNGSSFVRTEAHVDHADPWPFSKIVEAFVATEGIDLETVQYDGFEPGSSYVSLRDKKLANRFVAFHRRRAVLRVVSASGNLARG